MYRKIIFIALAFIAGYLGSVFNSNGSVVLAKNSVITGSEFRLVDDKGTPRGGIFFDETGNPLSI